MSTRATPTLDDDRAALYKSAAVASHTHDWHAWTREFGRRIRRARALLGLSQEQLARAAGVSQGAVSRLETGRQLGTPMLVAVKVHTVLARGLRALAPDDLGPDLQALAAADSAGPFADVPFMPKLDVRDRGVEQLVRIYHGVPARQREKLLGFFRATAEALSHDTEGNGRDD